MWGNFKELLASALLFAGLGLLEYHLILIKIYGTVRIYEGREWLLWVELIGAGLLMLLPADRFIKDIRSK